MVNATTTICLLVRGIVTQFNFCGKHIAELGTVVQGKAAIFQERLINPGEFHFCARSPTGQVFRAEEGFTRTDLLPLFRVGSHQSRLPPQI